MNSPKYAINGYMYSDTKQDKTISFMSSLGQDHLCRKLLGVPLVQCKVLGLAGPIARCSLGKSMSAKQMCSSDRPSSPTLRKACRTHRLCPTWWNSRCGSRSTSGPRLRRKPLPARDKSSPRKVLK